MMDSEKKHTILFATHNRNKTQEAQALLPASLVLLTCMGDHSELKNISDIPETGSTFEENAEQKVDFVLRIVQISVVADDSGLIVDALGGKPGVHSKRWIEGTDEDRNNHLLKELEGQINRKAQFVTVLCYYDQETQEKHFFKGVVDGTIAHTTMGTDGFGYDPVFIPDGYSKTFAELGIDVKNTLSHRARAFEMLKNYLLDLDTGY